MKQQDDLKDAKDKKIQNIRNTEDIYNERSWTGG